MTPEEKANELFTESGYLNDYWCKNMAHDAARIMHILAKQMQILSDTHYAARSPYPMEVRHKLPPIVPALVAEIKAMLEANDYANAREYWYKVEMEVAGLELTEQ